MLAYLEYGSLLAGLSDLGFVTMSYCGGYMMLCGYLPMLSCISFSLDWADCELLSNSFLLLSGLSWKMRY